MISAFIIGFVGSLHCVGMCGPLNLLVLKNSNSLRPTARYHIGRILAYAILGILLGFLGESLQIIKMQQVTAFVLGAGLLLLYGIPSMRHKIERFYYQSTFYRFIQKKLTSGFAGKGKWILSGFANGFLPCGLTYVAAASAIAIGGLFEGILFMTLFGLGTLPALLLVTLSGTWSARKWKMWIPRAISLVAILSGSILIFRGLLLSYPDFNQLVQTEAAALITVCGLK